MERHVDRTAKRCPRVSCNMAKLINHGSIAREQMLKGIDTEL
jgi:hypothetical protein